MNKYNYESIITENGDIKWLLNIQNLWIDNNWEWRYQMITKYTEFMNREWEWRYQMITKYTEFMNR